MTRMSDACWKLLETIVLRGTWFLKLPSRDARTLEALARRHLVERVSGTFNAYTATHAGRELFRPPPQPQDVPPRVRVRRRLSGVGVFEPHPDDLYAFAEWHHKRGYKSGRARAVTFDETDADLVTRHLAKAHKDGQGETDVKHPDYKRRARNLLKALQERQR